jgi:hypothetical protein
MEASAGARRPEDGGGIAKTWRRRRQREDLETGPAARRLEGSLERDVQAVPRITGLIIPLSPYGITEIFRGINWIRGMGWDVGLVENPIPLEILT